MEQKEQWRDVVGYEGLYKVSDLGNILSMNYLGCKGKVLQMSPSPDTYGYLQVILSNKSRRKAKKVHRLVAEAFIPNPCGLRCINHKDENKQNNCVENLEWCTVKYNNNYGSRIAKMVEKLSVPILQFTKKGEFVKEHPSIEDAYKSIGFSIRGRDYHISACCKGKRNVAYGFVWRYKDREREMQAKKVRDSRASYISKDGCIRRRTPKQE